MCDNCYVVNFFTGTRVTSNETDFVGVIGGFVVGKPPVLYRTVKTAECEYASMLLKIEVAGANISPFPPI